MSTDKVRHNTLWSLKEIIQHFDRIDPKDMMYFHDVPEKNLIRFVCLDENLAEKIALDTMIPEPYPPYPDDYWYYIADKTEYEQVYGDTSTLEYYIGNEVKPLYEFLNFNADEYKLALLKFEVPMLTFANAVKGSSDIYGEPSEQVKKKTLEFLKMFVFYVKERKEQIALVRSAMDEAEEKAWWSLMDDEITHVQRHIL